MVGVVSWSIANMHDAWWELLEKDAGVVLLEGMSTMPQELRDRVEVSPRPPYAMAQPWPNHRLSMPLMWYASDQRSTSNFQPTPTPR